MPNWIEGTLKLRGKSENLKRFFNEYVRPSGWLTDNEGREVIEFIQTNFDGNYCEASIMHEPYIKGTTRAFLGEDDYVYWDEAYATIALDIKQAWCFKREEFAKISEECGIDIRLYGFERGMEFCQDVEIIDGEVVKDNVIEYDDWDWECPCPKKGG